MTRIFGHDPAALAGRLRTPLLADALDALGLRRQAIGPGIVPLAPADVLIGSAFTVNGALAERVPEVPYVGLLASLEAIGPGEVYVVSSAGSPAAALFGELMATACSARRAAGALCDGYVRDAARVRALGFPCFARGTLPLDSNGRFEITGHGEPVTVDGVEISCGDLIVADEDGVVVAPAGVAAEALARALEKDVDEGRFRDAIRAGMPPFEAFERFRVL